MSAGKQSAWPFHQRAHLFVFASSHVSHRQHHHQGQSNSQLHLASSPNVVSLKAEVGKIEGQTAPSSYSLLGGHGPDTSPILRGGVWSLTQKRDGENSGHCWPAAEAAHTA